MNGAPSIISLAIVGLLFLAWRACRRAAGADWGKVWVNAVDGLNRVFCRRYHSLDASIVNLPAQGAALVAANHLSGLDPLLMAAVSPRPLRFLIAREQYERFGLRWLFRAIGCIPVDRGGGPERALRDALRALESGEVVALFPQGRIDLPTNRPRPLKGGVAWLACRAGVPVYGLRISGVSGAGRVVRAVFQRSRAHIDISGPLICEDGGQGLLRHLQELWDGPPP